MEVNMDADNSEYLAQLQAERDNLDSTFTNASKLLAKEIQRIQSGGTVKGNDGLIDVLKDKFVKIQERVIIPVKEYPKFNFVGKLLGPKGASLKRLQEETQTKMSILGKGSMKDKRKEEELRKEGGKYAHLNDELHVLVEVYAPPAECHSRMAHAFFELKKYLNPTVQDEIHQQQLEEMMFLQSETGGPPGPPGMRGRGRGGQSMSRGRGAPAPRGVPAPRGAPSLRGASSLRGAPSSGRGASRGAVPSLAASRGASRGSLRGVGGRGAPRSRGALGSQPRSMGLGRSAPAPVSLSAYEEEPYSRPIRDLPGFKYSSYEDAYAEPSYQDPYEQPESTQLYDYGHQSTAAGEEYEDGYGAGYSEAALGDYGVEEAWNGTTASTGYGKVMSSRGQGGGRAHPYGRGSLGRF